MLPVQCIHQVLLVLLVLVVDIFPKEQEEHIGRLNDDKDVNYMILFKNKGFTTNSDHPNDDWIGNADWVIPDGSELAEKIISLYPNFEFVFDDNGKPVDVIETEPAPVPPLPPTNAELAAAIAELAEVICGG